MNYIKSCWNASPNWAKGAAAVALSWGLAVNAGNGLVAKHELGNGYTPAQADARIKARFGQM